MIQENTIINVGNTRTVDVIDSVLSTSRSIDIMRRMAERDMGWNERIDSEFDRITDLLGRVPTRM